LLWSSLGRAPVTDSALRRTAMQLEVRDRSRKRPRESLALLQEVLPAEKVSGALSSLASLAVVRTALRGELLVEQGHPCASIMIVLAGTVDCVATVCLSSRLGVLAGASDASPRSSSADRAPHSERQRLGEQLLRELENPSGPGAAAKVEAQLLAGQNSPVAASPHAVVEDAWGGHSARLIPFAISTLTRGGVFGMGSDPGDAVVRQLGLLTFVRPKRLLPAFTGDARVGTVASIPALPSSAGHLSVFKHATASATAAAAVKHLAHLRASRHGASEAEQARVAAPTSRRPVSASSTMRGRPPPEAIPLRIPRLSEEHAASLSSACLSAETCVVSSTDATILIIPKARLVRLGRRAAIKAQRQELHARRAGVVNATLGRTPSASSMTGEDGYDDDSDVIDAALASSLTELAVVATATATERRSKTMSLALKLSSRGALTCALGKLPSNVITKHDAGLRLGSADADAGMAVQAVAFGSLHNLSASTKNIASLFKPPMPLSPLDPDVLNPKDLALLFQPSSGDLPPPSTLELPPPPKPPASPQPSLRRSASLGSVIHPLAASAPLRGERAGVASLLLSARDASRWPAEPPPLPPSAPPELSRDRTHGGLLHLRSDKRPQSARLWDSSTLEARSRVSPGLQLSGSFSSKPRIRQVSASQVPWTPPWAALSASEASPADPFTTDEHEQLSDADDDDVVVLDDDDTGESDLEVALLLPPAPTTSTHPKAPVEMAPVRESVASSVRAKTPPPVIVSAPPLSAKEPRAVPDAASFQGRSLVSEWQFHIDAHEHEQPHARSGLVEDEQFQENTLRVRGKATMSVPTALPVFIDATEPAPAAPVSYDGKHRYGAHRPRSAQPFVRVWAPGALPPRPAASERESTPESVTSRVSKWSVELPMERSSQIPLSARQTTARTPSTSSLPPATSKHPPSTTISKRAESFDEFVKRKASQIGPSAGHGTPVLTPKAMIRKAISTGELAYRPPVPHRGVVYPTKKPPPSPRASPPRVAIVSARISSRTRNKSSFGFRSSQPPPMRVRSPLAPRRCPASPPLGSDTSIGAASLAIQPTRLPKAAVESVPLLQASRVPSEIVLHQYSSSHD
jgi:hypothetical protein